MICSFFIVDGREDMELKEHLPDHRPQDTRTLSTDFTTLKLLMVRG